MTESKLSQPAQVHMFWAYGALSRLEHLCVSSFVAQGYKVRLWSYDKIPNLPRGVKLADARQIIPERRLFLNRSGSYASFADLFRYAVLNEKGGLYADTDVAALKPLAPMLPFLVTERMENSKQTIVNNNVIFQPHRRRKGVIIDMAHAVADRFPPGKIIWAEIGPRLIDALVKLQTDHGYRIMPPDFANPVDWWNCPKALLKPGCPLPPRAGFLHCYADMWRRAGVDKNAPFPKGSMMERLEQRVAKQLA